MRHLSVRVVGLSVVLLGSLTSAPAAHAAAALPQVDMEAALKAAQWDPQKTGTGITPGAKGSVLAIERALRDEGMLSSTYVDGHYGTATVTAYTTWQKSLGYRGLGANGIPGEASLKKLGVDRFAVTHVVRPGARTTFGGETVDARTKDMLVEAQSLSGLTIRLDQGSYSTSDPTSAGTHDGGGAVDINVDGWTAQQRSKVVTKLRNVGFAAWLRTPSEGNWPIHIHAVAISDPDLSPPAQAQVGDYYLGRNGLKDDGPDTGPDVPKVTWEEYQRVA